MGTTRPKRGEAFGVGVFEGDDPDEDVYRTKTLGGDEIGHTYEIMVWRGGGGGFNSPRTR